MPRRHRDVSVARDTESLGPSTETASSAGRAACGLARRWPHLLILEAAVVDHAYDEAIDLLGED